jgi:hypothetical protein
VTPWELIGEQVTVTVTAALSAGGTQKPLTRTQYFVSAVGLTVTKLLLVDPPIGLPVWPELPVNHWYVNGPVPLALTEIVLDCPVGTDEGDAKGVDADGGTQGLTLTVVAGLSAVGAHCPVTRTQYDVVDVGLTVIELLLVDPPIGFPVWPELPLYH